MKNYFTYNNNIYYKSKGIFYRYGFVVVKCDVYSAKANKYKKDVYGESKVALITQKSFKKLLDDAILNACYSAFPNDSGYSVNLKNYFILYEANKTVYKVITANRKKYAVSMNKRSKKIKYYTFKIGYVPKEKSKKSVLKKHNIENIKKDGYLYKNIVIKENDYDDVKKYFKNR